VAPVTVRRTQCVVIARMAGGAGGRQVCSDQSEPGGTMVKSRRRPTYCCMTYGTVPYRKLRTRRRVHRIGRLLPSRQMATRHSATVQRGRQRIVVVGVTRSAGHSGVPIGKWEPRCAVVE
jgi:hypothetical protein